jgi:hypothetical protein
LVKPGVTVGSARSAGAAGAVLSIVVCASALAGAASMLPTPSMARV